MLDRMSADQPVYTRRTAILGAATMGSAAALGACSNKKATPAPRGPGTPSNSGATRTAGGSSPAPASETPPPDPQAVVAAIAREVALLAAYDGVPGDAAALVASFRQHHETHLTRLEGLPGASRRTAGTPSRTSTPTPIPRPSSSPAATSSSRAVVAALARAEDEASRAGAAACAAAGPTAFAQLLAEIAGSEGQHAVLLPGLDVATAP